VQPKEVREGRILHLDHPHDLQPEAGLGHFERTSEPLPPLDPLEMSADFLELRLLIEAANPVSGHGVRVPTTQRQKLWPSAAAAEPREHTPHRPNDDSLGVETLLELADDFREVLERRLLLVQVPAHHFIAARSNFASSLTAYR